MIRQLGQLRLLGRCLGDSYPYTFLIGQWLRLERKDWWAEFELKHPRTSALPLLQAQDYAFACFCEQQHVTELDQMLDAEFFPSAPKYLKIELLNTVNWYSTLLDPRRQGQGDG